MKSKYDIIREFERLQHHSGTVMYIENVKEAMDEYGKELAIGFANWILESNYDRMGHAYYSNRASSWKTSAQLFEIYLETLYNK